MARKAEDAIFKPSLSRAEAKGDATTRAALEIIEREASARIAKTERLRAARLAQETDEAAIASTKPSKRGRKTAAPRRPKKAASL